MLIMVKAFLLQATEKEQNDSEGSARENKR